VSGQLHAPAALPPGKGPPVPIGQEVGWTPETVWTRWGKFLTLPGFELDPSVVQPVVSRYTDYAACLFNDTFLTAWVVVWNVSKIREGCPARDMTLWPILSYCVRICLAP
jgi:hypothetical protein